MAAIDFRGFLVCLPRVFRAEKSFAAEVPALRVRASQINGCAFCVQYHILQGEGLGIAIDKLNLVVVWREAPLFSPRERAALAWTEALTLLTAGVSDEIMRKSVQNFPKRSWPISPRPSLRSMSGTGLASPIAGRRRSGKKLFMRHREVQFSPPSFLMGRSTSSGNAWATAGKETDSGPISRPRPRIKCS
jgi:AhpD family alkylhydroperoxidase